MPLRPYKCGASFLHKRLLLLKYYSRVVYYDHRSITAVANHINILRAQQPWSRNMGNFLVSTTLES